MAGAAFLTLARLILTPHLQRLAGVDGRDRNSNNPADAILDALLCDATVDALAQQNGLAYVASWLPGTAPPIIPKLLAAGYQPSLRTIRISTMTSFLDLQRVSPLMGTPT